jgi:hypothetical protein
MSERAPERRSMHGVDSVRDDLHVECRVYTHGRRHPIVIGNIQGLRIPPVTPAQLFVGVAGLVFLVATQSLWAHFGWAVNGTMLIAVPLGLAFTARALRIEGRAPWRAGLGWANLALAPRNGRRLGHTEVRRRVPRRYDRTWIAEVRYRGAAAGATTGNGSANHRANGRVNGKGGRS